MSAIYVMVDFFSTNKHICSTSENL